MKLSVDHDEVLLDLSVVGESTHWVNGLVGNVVPSQIQIQKFFAPTFMDRMENEVVRINSQDIFMAIKW